MPPQRSGPCPCCLSIPVTKKGAGGSLLEEGKLIPNARSGTKNNRYPDSYIGDGVGKDGIRGPETAIDITRECGRMGPRTIAGTGDGECCVYRAVLAGIGGDCGYGGQPRSGEIQKRIDVADSSLATRRH